jgi:hypothetical protein
MPRAGESIEEWEKDSDESELSIFDQMINDHLVSIMHEGGAGLNCVQPKSSLSVAKGTKVLVLFHTKGSYQDDWEPMTPIGNTSNFKWNGQNCHRDDHLMTTHGKNALIVCRDKKTNAFTFYGTIENILPETLGPLPKGTPRRFIIKNAKQETFNGVDPDSELPRCNGMAWMKSALHKLGLQHVSGNHLGGIQLCSVI